MAYQWKSLLDKVVKKDSLYNEDTEIIKSEHLPSYVDDVLEYNQFSDFPTHGESGKIYIDKSTNNSYRWSGTQYIKITDSALDSRISTIETSLSDLDEIRSGAALGATALQEETYKGTVTSVSVKMNDVVQGIIVNSGTIDLGVVITEHQDISGKADIEDIPTKVSLLENDSNYTLEDGYYNLMHVGKADELSGFKKVVDLDSFFYRPAGGTADIADGTATVTEFNGKTIVWNQQLPELNSSNVTATGKCSFTDKGLTYTGNGVLYYQGCTITSANKPNLIANHKYYIAANVTENTLTTETERFIITKSMNAAGLNVKLGRTTGFKANIITLASKGEGIGNVIGFSNASGAVVIPEGEKVSVDKAIVIDLTQMFGADNEPATVEEFESMFPLPYYDYNEGELVSFNGTAIKSVGFNAYNPATGKAEVVGGNVYQITGTYTSITLDGVAITPDADGHFTPSHNGELVVVGGNNIDTCIHLSHSGYRDGEYEPYWTAERELPVSKINTDGTITDSSTGKTRLFPNGLLSAGSVKDSITRTGAVKRLGIVNMGDLTWYYASQYDAYYCNIYGKNYGIDNVVNSIYSLTNLSLSSLPDKSLRGHTNNNAIYVRDSAYTDAAAFKTAMSGVMLYYELATPIEVTFAEPLNLSYKVSDFGTEQLLPVNGSEPVTTWFDGKISYGINPVYTLLNLSQDYISKESMNNFIRALGVSLGKTITMTWNDHSSTYDFTIT